MPGNIDGLKFISNQRLKKTIPIRFHYRKSLVVDKDNRKFVSKCFVNYSQLQTNSNRGEKNMLTLSNCTFTIDTHTMGEPTRILVNNVPKVVGSTMKKRKEYMQEHYDWLREV